MNSSNSNISYLTHTVSFITHIIYDIDMAITSYPFINVGSHLDATVREIGFQGLAPSRAFSFGNRPTSTTSTTAFCRISGISWRLWVISPVRMELKLDEIGPFHWLRGGFRGLDRMGRRFVARRSRFDPVLGTRQACRWMKPVNG